jgi:hypothetical protein
MGGPTFGRLVSVVLLAILDGLDATGLLAVFDGLDATVALRGDGETLPNVVLIPDEVFVLALRTCFNFSFSARRASS